MAQKQEPETDETSRMGSGIAVGAALGLALGLVLGNLPVGLLLGLAAGVGLGAALDSRRPHVVAVTAQDRLTAIITLMLALSALSGLLYWIAR